MLLGELVGLLFQGGLLDLQLDDFPAHHVQLGGHGVHLGTDHGAGLVNEVDGLVGEEPVGDIAVGEGGGGNDGSVGDLHPVVDLIPLLQTPKDGYGVLHRGLPHQHRLKPPFQGGVLLDILAVLVEGGGPNAVELPPGQEGLEEVARIHSPLGLTRPYDGVKLVNEEQDSALRLLHLVQNGLEPLLKLAPVLGPGDEGAHIQGKDGLVLQRGWHVPLHDPLGQPLGNGSLTYPGLTDEHRVVFGLAGENTDHVPNLIVPADHWIQLVLPGPLHQVRAVFLQCVIGLLRVVRGDPLAPPHPGEGLEDLLLGDAVDPEKLAQGSVRDLGQSQQQMLHRHIFILHASGGLLGLVEGLVHLLGNIDLPRLPAGAGYLGQLAQLLIYSRLQGGQGEPHGGEELGHQSSLGGQ